MYLYAQYFQNHSQVHTIVPRAMAPLQEMVFPKLKYPIRETNLHKNNHVIVFYKREDKRPMNKYHVYCSCKDDLNDIGVFRAQGPFMVFS